MAAEPDESSFQYTGTFGEFLGVAIGNIVLTLATLGIYRFWATARERRLLWSRSQFIDDGLEWTGTGRELFFGFLIALFVFVFPLTLLYLVLQGLVMRDQPVLAGALIVAITILLTFLRGFANFRGLRYRLTRTWWHGINGGGEGSALRYGGETLLRNLASWLTLGAILPWVNTRLWRSRWQRMFFGNAAFASSPRWKELIGFYMLMYVMPVLIIGVPAFLISRTVIGGGRISFYDPDNVMVAILATGLILVFSIVWSIIAIAYYARYAAEVVGSMRLEGLAFEFTATTANWLWLIVSNFVLVSAAYLLAIIPLAMIGALSSLRTGFNLLSILNHPSVLITLLLTLAIPVGLAGAIARYRRWRFYIRHLEAGGEIDIASLTRRDSARMRQGEGLLDALDMGAI
jgi:uncharacterized membrane protein YjgN (DUF898 family)